MTITEKLRELAVQTKMRVGEHPDYNTLIEAVELIEKLSEEKEPKVEPEPKPKRSRSRKV